MPLLYQFVVDRHQTLGGASLAVLLLVLSGAGHAAPGAAPDPARSEVSVTATDGEAAEAGLQEAYRNRGTFTFIRTGSTSTALSVPIRVSGSATPGQDYPNLMPLSVTFPPGIRTVTKTITPWRDHLVEGPETVVLSLQVGQGYRLGKPASAEVKIKDADSHALNDTGSTRCADAGYADLECPVSDYPGQDGEHGRDVTHNDDRDGRAGFSFTKIANNGKPLPNSAQLGTGPNDWACTRDNITGLMWEVKTDDGGLRDQRWIYTWYDPDPRSNGGDDGLPVESDDRPFRQLAYCFDSDRCDTATYVEDVNRTRLCGHSDWRLPDLFELISISTHPLRTTDPGAPPWLLFDPAIDTVYFPNTEGMAYWTATTNARHVAEAWTVSVEEIETWTWEKGWNAYGVRLVR